MGMDIVRLYWNWLHVPVRYVPVAWFQKSGVCQPQMVFMASTGDEVGVGVCSSERPAGWLSPASSLRPGKGVAATGTSLAPISTLIVTPLGVVSRSSKCPVSGSTVRSVLAH